ncbi:MAG TPA: L-dopachrome tautomerase-related protein [Kofleriaceae bacterium]|nr:L-dopachrome tautomerase-related protein [Kofleriaceae bacterium]
MSMPPRRGAVLAAVVVSAALAGWLLPPPGRLLLLAAALVAASAAIPAALLRRRRGLGAAGGIAALAVLCAAGLRLRYGGGDAYPDVTGKPILSERALEPVVRSDEPIGNVAVSSDGRVFYTIHPESRPEGARLLEWRGARGVPWPSAEAQGELGEVLGLAVDGRGRLWAIGHGGHGASPPRLVAFDLATGQLAHRHDFTDAQIGSFYQDLEVSRDGGTVYIADASFWRRNPAVVVYDVGRGEAVRRLEDDASVYPQPWIIRTPAGPMTFLGGLVALQTGIDGLVLSEDDRWLYYAAMSHDTLYRVKTADLRDPALSPDDLAARVEAVGRKPLSDGLGIDAAGNAIVTDVEHGGLVRIAPDGASTTLLATRRIRWSDGVTYGPGGWLYIADSDIPDLMLRSKEHIRESGPYFVWRIHPDIGGLPGR